MATSDHNMTRSQNSEISSEPTLKKQTVRIADLIQADKGINDKMCYMCMLIMCCIVAYKQRLYCKY